MKPTSGPAAQRRTQEMRSAETRAKILDATLECLIERGYSATSTPEVCRRAGMSRGALLHHFPTKEELVISAVTHLADRRAGELLAPPHAVDQGLDPLDRVFETIWAAFFSGPLFHAALELWVAARCDRELHAALYPVERAMGRGIRQFYATIAHDGASHDPERNRRFEEVVSLSTHLVRGMALQKILKDDDASRRRLFDTWKHLARLHVDGVAR